LNSGNLIQNDRKRFTAFHELVHLLFTFPEGMTDKRKEELCHYFAGAMLFSRDATAQELGKHRNRFFFNELGTLKQYYGISMQALIYRLKNLDIISKAYHQQFLTMIRHLGWKVEEPFPFQESETSNRFNQLIFRLLRHL
jgi:Zn-dependent peptidase ImmA (M78 family)